MIDNGLDGVVLSVRQRVEKLEQRLMNYQTERESIIKKLQKGLSPAEKNRKREYRLNLIEKTLIPKLQSDIAQLIH